MVHANRPPACNHHPQERDGREAARGGGQKLAAELARSERQRGALLAAFRWGWGGVGGAVLRGALLRWGGECMLVHMGGRI